MTWFPVIEHDHGQERFLIEDPVQMFREGNFAKVPVIVGRTKDEFVDIPYRKKTFFCLFLNLKLNFRDDQQRDR